MVDMRLDGEKPRGPVWVNAGNFPDPDWWRYANSCHEPELVVRPEDPLERLDFRCLIDLPVILYFGDFDARADAVYRRLTEYAKAISVLSPSFGEDIGWFWFRGHGRVEFEDRPKMEVAWQH